MREIKFRAWFKDTQEMKSVAMNNLYMGNKSSWMHLSPQPMSDYRLVEIMQYTGLKDKNGREIYEGDVIHYTKVIYADCTREEIEDVKEPVIGKFYYAEGLYPGIQFKDGTGSLFLPGTIDSDEFEVIGNIHENPELLGDDK